MMCGAGVGSFLKEKTQQNIYPVEPGLVMNHNADHAMSDTSSQPDMFMRRETRSLSQRLAGILCNIREKLNCQ